MSQPSGYDSNKFTRKRSSTPSSHADQSSSLWHSDSEYNEPSHRRGSSPTSARSPSSGPMLGYSTSEILNNRSQKVLRGFIRRYGDCDDRPDPSKRRKTCSATQPGRGIRKVVDLYHDIDDLVDKARLLAAISTLKQEGVQIDRSDFAGLRPEEIEERKKDLERCHKALQLLNKVIPGFEENAIASRNISAFCVPLQTGANDARSNDTNRLKVAVAEWLNSRWPKSSPNTRISPRSKEDRGINNDVTGRLLCPIDYNWDDPQVRAKLRKFAPGYDFNSTFFLRCLYEGENGDPQCPQIGFLKGPLLLRAFRHIFTSPSSADNEDSTAEITSRRRDVATTLRLNGHVTARSIAYAATQLIFSLSSAREWRQEHAGFHYPSFYNFIVDLLEDEDERTRLVDVGELFRWWDSKVFPPATNKLKSSAAARNAMKSSLERLRRARVKTEEGAL